MDIYTGEDAGQITRHKSRYGHKDWVIWRDRQGVWHSARLSPESVKTALLASGMQGKFVVVYGSAGGAGCVWNWWMGCNYLKSVRIGYTAMFD